MLKFAIVCGWGAVEREAAQWSASEEARIAEVAPRLWEIRADGDILGYIAKEPWTLEGVAQEGNCRFDEALGDRGIERSGGRCE